jgi:phage portal protein BeeE
MALWLVHSARVSITSPSIVDLYECLSLGAANDMASTTGNRKTLWAGHDAFWMHSTSMRRFPAAFALAKHLSQIL